MQENIPLLLNHDSSKVIGHVTLYDDEFIVNLTSADPELVPEFVLSWGVRLNDMFITELGLTSVPVFSDDTPRWNLISEVGLPGPEHDWVLVKTDFLDGEAVPHVAELRQGQWWDRDISDAPLEEVLGVKVIAWFDMQTIL